MYFYSQEILFMKILHCVHYGLCGIVEGTFVLDKCGVFVYVQ